MDPLQEIQDCSDYPPRYLLSFVRFDITTRVDKSSEEGLLLWCKNVTDGYAGVSIDNFKSRY